MESHNNNYIVVASSRARGWHCMHVILRVTSLAAETGAVTVGRVLACPTASRRRPSIGLKGEVETGHYRAITMMSRDSSTLYIYIYIYINNTYTSRGSWSYYSSFFVVPGLILAFLNELKREAVCRSTRAPIVTSRHVLCTACVLKNNSA